MSRCTSAHRTLAIVSSVATALLLASCGTTRTIYVGRWPAENGAQAYVTTPGATPKAGQTKQAVRTPETAVAKPTTGTTPAVAVATPTSPATAAPVTTTAATTTPSEATKQASPEPQTAVATPTAQPAGAAPATLATPVAVPTSGSAGFEITSSTPSLPVHRQAPQLGDLPNANPDDTTASRFRPTTANDESMEPSTQNVSRVTYAEEGADFDPSLSEDGEFMVFASTSHRATSDIYLKRVSSRVVTQLTNDPARDMCPRISPDGKQIAFCSDRSGNWDVYVMPTEGGRPVQVTFDPSDEISPSWSPDGKQLVYSRMGENSGRWEMWVADVKRPEVANFIGYGLFPQWCPVSGTGKDGADQVLFQVGRERGRRTFGVWTIDIAEGQAGNATEIRSSSANALINPSWSPDGRWVVFAEVPLNVGEAKNAPLNGSTPVQQQINSALWLVSVENEAPVRLTFGNRLAVSPVWSRTNKLYFVSNNTGVENIWSLDMSKPLTTAAAMIRDQSNTYAAQPEDGAELHTEHGADR